jgi:hypothetical protein
VGVSDNKRKKFSVGMVIDCNNIGTFRRDQTDCILVYIAC